MVYPFLSNKEIYFKVVVSFLGTVPIFYIFDEKVENQF